MSNRARRQGQLDADSALKSYFQDPEWMFKTGIGGMLNAGAVLLTALNPLLMPAVCALFALVSGYLLRVIRYKVLNPESKLPDWNDWLELFISGLTWLAVQFGLSLIVISLGTVSLMLTGAMEGAGKTGVLAALTGFAILTLLSAVLLSLFTPFLMINFAVEERAAAGFAFRKIARRIASAPRPFITAWLLGIGIMWASVLLPALTVVGIFLLPSTLFMGHVLAATVCAQVWGPDGS